MKKTLDDIALQTMLDNSQYRKAQSNNSDYWFSFQNQKQLIFHLASSIYTTDDCTAEDAIDEAKQFVNIFYNNVMDPSKFKKEQ